MERLSLTTVEFEGDNNVYLLDDGPSTVLVDTGYSSEKTRTQLVSGLEKRGVLFSDVDRIFLTHWHADHIGLAGEIQQASGAEVFIHSQDAALVENNDGAWDDLRKIQTSSFNEWGIPETKQLELFDRMETSRTDTEPPAVIPFEDGDEFSVNSQKLRVRHAPGHTAGLCMFEWEHDGVRDIFSGDVILPVYTPNVGGADIRVENSLTKYLRTLRDVVNAEYNRAWPGHRTPISDPTERARNIIEHHEERAWRVLDALHRHGPCNVWTVSDDLFGELEGIHIIHGPGESYAHLEHLERHGVVTRTGREYDITDDVVDTINETTENRWSLKF